MSERDSLFDAPPDEPLSPEEFDAEAEAYNRRVLGWEFDLLQIEQQAERAMSDV